MNTKTLKKLNPACVQPWWSFGMVWMVIAGPAVVVVAAFVTLYLAITIPDPVLPTEAMNPRNALENQGKLEAAMAQPCKLAIMQARAWCQSPKNNKSVHSPNPTRRQTCLLRDSCGSYGPLF